MKHLFIALLAAALTFCSCNSQTPDYEINYRIGFDTCSHYVNVNMQLSGDYISSDKDITLKLPVWAPGYYMIVDFPKYIVDFEACDGSGNELYWEKLGKNGWSIKGADTINVSYKVLADMRSVVECRVEKDAAFVPGNGVFMHLANEVSHPVSLSIDLPSNWSNISCSLKEKDGIYYADNFDILYDSPILAGNHLVKKAEHNGHLYEFAVETPQGFEESGVMADFLACVDEAVAIFDDVPYESYHLLLMGAGRGGLEHQSSQADYTAGHWDFDTKEEYLDELMFLVHEYFHNYNVKAIRPIELGPFDYDKENYTTGLWISEGITCFYESTLLMRAGIISEQQHLDYISGYIRNTQNTEGRKHMSLRRGSNDIWFNFFNSNSNASDVTISYYVKGPVVGFLLDTKIRTVSNGAKSLDDVMNRLYHEYYKEKGRGFTEEEFWSLAEEVAGGSLGDVRRYVDTTDEIDYESILAPAGIKIDRNDWSMERI